MNKVKIRSCSTAKEKLLKKNNNKNNNKNEKVALELGLKTIETVTVDVTFDKIRIPTL